VFILKGVKAICFDTLLQVLILKGLMDEQFWLATGARRPLGRWNRTSESGGCTPHPGVFGKEAASD
jgi:hypothetical protein